MLQTEPSTLATIVDVVGVLGAVGAVVVGILGHRASKRHAARELELGERADALDSVQTKLNRRLVEIEEGRDARAELTATQAELRAGIMVMPRGIWFVRLDNVGAAPATNIRVSLEGAPIEEFQYYLAGTGPERPFDLGEDGGVTWKLSVGLGGDIPPWTVEVLWDDASGTDRRWASTITS